MTRHRLGLFGASFLAAATCGLAPSAVASPEDHVKGSYPQHGYYWIANGASVPIYHSSDRCKPAEDDFRESFEYQLRGANEGNAGQYRGRWGNGINIYHYQPDAPACSTTQVTFATDIHFDWMTPAEWASAGHTPDFGGHNHSSPAPPTWCAAAETTHPCGYHPSRVHLNENRYAGYPDRVYKRRFLMHEAGHSMGFNDDCSEPSITNSGGGGCNITNGYVPLDRTGLRDHIY